MELILKSDNKNKMEQVLALARKLGITVSQKKESKAEKAMPIPPKGKKVSAEDLLLTFGEAADFPSTEEVRHRTWPSSW